MKNSLRATWKKYLHNVFRMGLTAWPHGKAEVRRPRVGLAVEPLECRALLSTWAAHALQLTADPIQGLTVPFGAAQVAPQTGNVHLEQPLHLPPSASTSG